MKNKKLIAQVIVLGIAIVLVIGYLYFSNADKIKLPVKQSLKYDVTEVDIFSLQDIDGREVGVKGVTLGMDLEEVREKIGFPDVERTFPPDIINWEYGEGIGLGKIGLVIHFRNNIVEKIVVREPFNKFLIGKTQINHTKEDIYFLLGTPDKIDFVPVEENSAKAMRVYTYPEKHIQVLIEGGIQNGFVIYA